MSKYYIGIMCGTSLDSIDISIASITSRKIKIKGFSEYKLDHQFKDTINMIKTTSYSAKALHKINLNITNLIYKYVKHSLDKYRLKPEDIIAIGFPGITLNHRPDLKMSTFIGDPKLLSQKLKMIIISDFRQTDIDAGGQGAPLAGLFHQYLNAIVKKDLTYLNLGGFANITVPYKNKIISYDTGPANYLIDLWCNKNFDMEYDLDGQLASIGNVNTDLLKIMLNEKYFNKKYPKSTGFELFNNTWIDKHLKKVKNLSNIDILSTLTYLTIITVSNELKKFKNLKTQLFIYGGGAYNKLLINGIIDLSGVKRTDALKNIVNEKNLEATAFAWLAYMREKEILIDSSSITGTKKPYLMGKIY
tara:strand:+ start:556 stop:1638 length:1083 start_codon:yes stop_codon:yes gene_type:complete